MTIRKVSKRFNLAVASAIALSLVGPGLIPAASRPAHSNQSGVLLSSANLQPYIENYAEVVYRNYRDTRQQAAAMKASINAFLARPSKSTHRAAKAVWIQARQSYLQTEAFRFADGPIDFSNPDTGEEGPEGRINAWPMNEAFIDYVEGKPQSGLINNPAFGLSIQAILDNDQVSDEADVTTGWHAIEFLLWGQDLNVQGPGQRSFKDFIPNQGNNNRRREYLKLVTGQLLADLRSLEEAWKPGVNNYRATFVKGDPKATISKILTSLATLSAFEMASERMSVALDSGNQEDEHSCFSDTTYQDFVYDAQGIYNVYHGDYKGYKGRGFDELVAKLSPGVNQRTVAALDQTHAKVAAINQPFDQVLASRAGSPERDEVEAAIDAFEAQAVMFQEVGTVLGVKVEILAE